MSISTTDMRMAAADDLKRRGKSPGHAQEGLLICRAHMQPSGTPKFVFLMDGMPSGQISNEAASAYLASLEKDG